MVLTRHGGGRGRDIKQLIGNPTKKLTKRKFLWKKGHKMLGENAAVPKKRAVFCSKGEVRGPKKL